MKHDFMKQGEYISKGNKDQNSSLFSFSRSKWLLFFVSRMSAKENFVGKLQR
jgi:hypothetical protein